MQTIKQLALLIKSGEISPVDCLQEALKKIKKTNDKSHIFR